MGLGPRANGEGMLGNTTAGLCVGDREARVGEVDACVRGIRGRERDKPARRYKTIRALKRLFLVSLG